jgi:hypothetical protein
MVNVAIQTMFGVCGITNGPVVLLPGPPAVNPASQLVANTGTLDPTDLLNISTDDIGAMVKTHNRCPGMSFIPIIPEKNLEALVYLAKYHWRRQLKTLPVHWNAESMAAIKKDANLLF